MRRELTFNGDLIVIEATPGARRLFYMYRSLGTVAKPQAISIPDALELARNTLDYAINTRDTARLAIAETLIAACIVAGEKTDG